MKLAVLVGVAVAAAAQSAHAADWHYVAATSYIDLDSITIKGNKPRKIQFWTHNKVFGVQMNNLWVGRCDTHYTALVHTIVYKGGKLISDQKEPLDSMPTESPVNSISRQALEIACKQRSPGAKVDPNTIKSDISWQHPGL